MMFFNLGDLLFSEKSYGLRIALSFNLQSYNVFLFNKIELWKLLFKEANV